MSIKLVKKAGIERASNCKDAEDFLKEAAFFSSLPETCKNCGSDVVHLDYRYVNKDGGYEYYAVKCSDCGHRLPFGKYKSGGFFLKDWEAPFNGGDSETSRPKLERARAKDSTELPRVSEDMQVEEDYSESKDEYLQRIRDRIK